jgi:hypothetical protein
MKTKNRQGDAKADKSGSDLQNETPQKMEVRTSSFCGILFGINRLMSRPHQSRGPGMIGGIANGAAQDSSCGQSEYVTR